MNVQPKEGLCNVNETCAFHIWGGGSREIVHSLSIDLSRPLTWIKADKILETCDVSTGMFPLKAEERGTTRHQWTDLITKRNPQWRNIKRYVQEVSLRLRHLPDANHTKRFWWPGGSTWDATVFSLANIQNKANKLVWSQFGYSGATSEAVFILERLTAYARRRGIQTKNKYIKICHWFISTSEDQQVHYLQKKRQYKPIFTTTETLSMSAMRRFLTGYSDDRSNFHVTVKMNLLIPKNECGVSMDIYFIFKVRTCKLNNIQLGSKGDDWTFQM